MINITHKKINKNVLTNITLVFLLSGILTTSVIFSGVSNIQAQTPQKYYVSFAGDWTCSAAAAANGDNLKNKNVEYLQGLGDYAYQTDQICWIEDVIGDKVPFVKVAQGNHESSKEDGQDVSWKQLQTAYGINQDFFTVEHKNLYTIVLNTQLSLSAGSPQYQFLQTALNDAKSKKQLGTIDYVTVAMHKMIFSCQIQTDLSAGSSCGDHTITEVDGYKGVIQLLYQYADIVDLVAQGHDHNTQISKPLKLESGQLVVTNTNDPNAITFGVFGGAGRSLDSLPSVTEKPMWQFLNGADRQVPVFELDTEGKEMKVEFIKSTGQSLYSATVLGNLVTPVQEICGDGIDNDGDGQIDEGCDEICGDGIDNNGNGQIDEGCTPTGEAKKIQIVSSSATSQDAGKEIDKSYDGNCDTRLSSLGKGEKFTYTFDKSYKVSKIKIDGYHQDRAYVFGIEGKDKVYTIKAGGNNCPQLEEFDVSDQNIEGNSITIIGQGNSNTDYNSYREVEFWTAGGGEPTPVEICGDGIDNDGDGQIDENCVPNPVEICGDGIDNDGDGLIDEGCTPDQTGLAHDIDVNFIHDKNSEFDFEILGNNVTLKVKQNNTSVNIIGFEKAD